MGSTNITRLLVANRSEIAIRVFRAATELGIRTVAIYAEEDKLSLHRFKADEAYHLGEGAGPIAAYLDGPRIIEIAKRAGVDAIHPGYGFLSENPDFAQSCAEAGIIFVGPSPDTMRKLGDKVSARHIAIGAGVPVVPASEPLPDDEDAIRRIAAEIGYPLMLKASWGGGGRGMRSIESEAGLIEAVRSGKREAKAAFGRDEVYLEKLIRRARHVEVQLLGDAPPLFMIGPKGDAELANYRMSGRYYVVDRLFDVAELRLGLKQQQVVRITRTMPRRRRGA